MKDKDVFYEKVQEVIIYREYRHIACDCPTNGSWQSVLDWRSAAVERFKSDTIMFNNVRCVMGEIMHAAIDSGVLL